MIPLEGRAGRREEGRNIVAHNSHYLALCISIMIGFLDSMAYGLTPSIIAEWKRLFAECTCGVVQGEDSGRISDDRPILGRRVVWGFRTDKNDSSFRTSASEASVSEVEVSMSSGHM